jgi:hypothetical protein
MSLKALDLVSAKTMQPPASPETKNISQNSLFSDAALSETVWQQLLNLPTQPLLVSEVQNIGPLVRGDSN